MEGSQIKHHTTEDCNLQHNQSITEEEEETDEVADLIDVEVGVNLLDSIADINYLTALANESSSDGSAALFSNYDDEARLSLAYGHLETIPKSIVTRSCEHVKILDLSHNKITDLRFLTDFKNITSLILDNNPITENAHLPQMPKLHLLWMNHCKVACLFPWVRRLRQSCPRLQHLSLMGNPAAPSYLNGGTFYEYLQYRLFVISLFSSLVHLDDRTVTKDQRTEAHRLYRRPLFERLLSIGPSGGVVAGAATGSSTRAESSAILSSIIPDSALSNWKALHAKVAFMFDNKSSSHRSSRNLLV